MSFFENFLMFSSKWFFCWLKTLEKRYVFAIFTMIWRVIQNQNHLFPWKNFLLCSYEFKLINTKLKPFMSCYEHQQLRYLALFICFMVIPATFPKPTTLICNVEYHFLVGSCKNLGWFSQLINKSPFFSLKTLNNTTTF